MRYFTLLLFLLPAVAMRASAAEVEKPKSIEERVFDLEQEMLAAKFRLDNVESNKLEAHPYVDIDPTSSGFEILTTDYGSLAVSVQDVKALADGTKVTLQLGNLTTATLDDVGLEMRYGPRRPTPPDGADLTALLSGYNSWTTSLKEYSKKLDNSLAPGSWNSTEVRLPGVKPETLGFMRIWVTPRSISMKK